MSRHSDDEMTTPFLKDGSEPGPHAKAGPKAAGPNSMFGSFKEAKKRKVPRWALPMLLAAALVHAVMFVSMWIKTIWDIEQLDPPKTKFDLALAPPPPPPPPPPNSGQKQKPQEIKVKKIKVKDLTQPIKIEKDVVAVEQVNDNGV